MARHRRMGGQAAERGSGLADGHVIDAAAAFLAQPGQRAPRGALVLLRVGAFDDEQHRGGLGEPDPR
jgi:hypothetical protein